MINAKVRKKHRMLTVKVSCGIQHVDQIARSDLKHWVLTGEHTGLVKGGMDGLAQEFANLEYALENNVQFDWGLGNGLRPATESDMDNICAAVTADGYCFKDRDHDGPHE